MIDNPASDSQITAQDGARNGIQDGLPAAGIPLTGAPLAGSPSAGAPLAGSPPAGSPSARVNETLSVSVRVLAEAVHRSGGLSGVSFGPVTAEAGIRTHQRFISGLQERFPEAEVQRELPLRAIERVGEAMVSVSGRCDAIVIESGRILIVEAKTYLGLAENLPPGGERVHWAQSLLYAALYVRMHQPHRPVHAALAYVAADTGDITLLARPVNVGGLDDFLNSSLRVWSSLALSLRHWVQRRDESGRALKFPYGDLRAGQKRLMKEVVGIARHRLSLFACAPTGIGKTMAVLFPAIKALSHHYVGRVFYLTSMTSTRRAAEKACDDLRAAGQTLRSVTLTAKEKICLQKEQFCDIRSCPLALHYFDNLPKALAELLTVAAVTEDVLRDVALRHHVCPFELSLDLALYADVVIGDYNYAFDPRVRLSRFFANEDEHDLLLVDEAHNLPVRAREMYSARLSLKGIREVASAVKGLHASLDLSLRSLLAYCEKAAIGMAGDEPVLDTVERNLRASDVMVSGGFRATRTRPATLNMLLGRVTMECRTLIDAGVELEQRRLFLDTYFAMLFFLRVSDEFPESAYVTTYVRTAAGSAPGAFSAKPAAGTGVKALSGTPSDFVPGTVSVSDGYVSDGSELVISLQCLDAADFLRQQIEDRHAAVFFSATLHPMDYYQSITLGREASQRTESLQLPSPFPSENLRVLRCTKLSTKYNDRSATVQSVARMITAAVTHRVGNYLVFVPSFEYLRLIKPLLQHELANSGPRGERAPIRLMMQKQQMSDREKSAYLQAFGKFGEVTLVALAVIGGQFSEGIDLVGEQLSGVAIVGVGLPQLSPEREILRQYFGEKLGSGFEYAYQFPGFNRVQQAAGRVIRSETDRGFVLLIDDRYGRPDYESLFPGEWDVHDVDDVAALKDELQDFFG